MHICTLDGNNITDQDMLRDILSDSLRLPDFNKSMKEGMWEESPDSFQGRFGTARDRQSPRQL